MTKFKKIIPALCMLLISAVLMGTSTYAWFSMNTTVKAKGMEVKAKADSKFLQIVNANTEFSDAAAQIEAEAVNKTKEIRPTAAVKEVTDDALTALDNTIDASAIKWAEAFSADPDSSTKTGKYNEVTKQATATDGTNVYTLINTFKVRMNPKTGIPTATDLQVTGVTVTATATEKEQLKPAVSVLFVCGENFVLWKNGTFTTKVANNVLAATVNTEATQISVYIFFDGENGATTTNNGVAVGTDGYSVEFTLGIA